MAYRDTIVVKSFHKGIHYTSTSFLTLQGEVGGPPSSLEVRKSKSTDGTAPAADQQPPARGPEASCSAS